MSFYLKTTINNKVVIIVLLFLLLFFDSFAGPLRYLFSLIGLDVITYFPKFACLLFVFSEMIRPHVNKKIIQVLILLFPFAVIGIFYSVSFFPVLFTVFLISPLLFGIVAAKYIRLSEKSLFLIMLFIYILTAIGVYLDIYLDFPWKGFIYNLGGSEIEASREWGYFGLDRPAGFARLSASAAFYLVCTGLFVIGYVKKWWLKLVFCLIGIVAILATTNKAAFLAFIIALIAFFLQGEKRLQNILRTVLVYGLALIIILLPLSTKIIEYKINLSDPVNMLFLASFDMRLVDTWPQYIAGISEYGNCIIGVGFGRSGSASKYFAGDEADLLTVADNLALYLYGWFGLFSVIAVYYFARVSLSLFKKKNRIDGLFAVVLVAMLVVSITTDVIESQIFSLMLGLSIGLIVQNKKSYVFYIL